jgi:hypothetical protein
MAGKSFLLIKLFGEMHEFLNIMRNTLIVILFSALLAACQYTGRHAVAQSSQDYDYSKVKIPDEYKNLDFNSFLYGYKYGYEMGRKGQETSFPFHGIKNEEAVMRGFYAGQYDGLKGNAPN